MRLASGLSTKIPPRAWQARRPGLARAVLRVHQAAGEAAALAVEVGRVELEQARIKECLRKGAVREVVHAVQKAAQLAHMPVQVHVKPQLVLLIQLAGRVGQWQRRHVSNTGDVISFASGGDAFTDRAEYTG